jgi:uncharacterized Zn finger protein
MADWQQYFKPWILQRGAEYASNDRVELRMQRGGVTCAVVHGSVDYFVAIYAPDGDPEEMSCTCPYAQTGEPCKHMAAVLYVMQQVLPD